MALALGMVFWLWPAGEGSGVVEAEGNRPRVTKPYERDRDSRMEKLTKNPREEFEAARNRGLTEEEVRWVVEDFLGTGISAMPELVAPVQELLERRRVQQRWYLDTLVDGFWLTGEQKEIAKLRLGAALSEDQEAYLKAERDGETITIYQTAGNPILSVDSPFLPGIEAVGITPAARMLDVSLWLGLGRLAPWDLCDLDEAQREISRFDPGRAEQGASPRVATTKDAGTDEHYEDLDDPFEENSVKFMAAGSIFPLSMGQVDRIRAASNTYRVSQGGGVKRPGLIDEVKCLTSSQLKTLLLFRPEMADELMKELED